ncbi:MAG TPA: glycosyltransferase family 4 protein [Trichocoleus sp.]
MKITFVMCSGFSLSGGDRVVAVYAKQLQQRGHEVFIISRPLSKPGLREQIRSLLKGNGWITMPQSKSSYFDNFGVSCKLLDRARPVVDADLPDADVVIATWWETAEWVAKLSPSKGAKAYFVQHHEVFDYLPEEQAAASYRLPLHKIVVAQWLQDLMKTLYNDNNVSLVPNSVDTKQFYAPPRKKQAVPTVGMVYSHTPWKGCDLSLKAFALAAQRIPNMRLVTFGSSELTESLPLPPEAKFAYRPPQERLRDFYSQCDAWLFASRSEGFGLPILEAMACRTPVIGTPAGAAPELLADGAGILVEPENPEAIAQAIEQIYQMTEAEWQQMSEIAYARVNEYTWEDATDRFEAALQQAIEKSELGMTV